MYVGGKKRRRRRRQASILVKEFESDAPAEPSSAPPLTISPEVDALLSRGRGLGVGARGRKKQRRLDVAGADEARKRPADPPLQTEPNELWQRWATNRLTLPGDFGRILDPTLDEERRGDLFEMEDDAAQSGFAWAIPDNRALRICEAFAPLIEIGCGAGYWARLLRERGVEIAAFDRDVGADTRAAGDVGAQPWTRVEKGGPEQLRKRRFRDSTLVLCFPDDLDFREDDGEQPLPLSLACLQAFAGDTIIHIGELFGTQSPPARSLALHGHTVTRATLLWGRCRRVADIVDGGPGVP